jgi:Ca-activated chloride channel homolog
LLAATAPGAPPGLRADAYQDLALSFYREADGLATQNKHEEAQKLFREALDSAKRSLRLRPGDADTAWNLELAARRVHEEDEKKKQDDEKKKQDDKKDDKPQDDKQQDKSDSDKQDPKDGDKQDSDKQDPKDGDKQKKPDPPQDKPEDKKGDQAKPQNQPPKPEQKQPQNADDSAEQQPEPHALPKEAAQALDSLEGGEENFERYRARQRAARERRAPEKDW